MERIDFSKSNIYWDGTSKGIFKLVSVLKINRLKSEKSETIFGLADSVLAGNMYVSEGLVKQPSYLFQLAGSSWEQYIFRTFLPNQKKSKLPSWVKKNSLIGDSHKKKLFNEFFIDIKKISARKILNYDDIEAVFFENNFTARVKFENSGYKFSVEFPVNHINIKPEIKMWQVETGPLLFPILEDVMPINLELLPCFTHFNSFEKLDVFYDYPFGLRGKLSKNKRILQNVDCIIEMFSSLN